MGPLPASDLPEWLRPCHRWDLAVATGKDAALDDELVEACCQVAEPQIGMPRASAFAEGRPVPPDASGQIRRLAMLGRSG